MSPSKKASISIGTSNIEDISIALPTCNKSFSEPVNLFLSKNLMEVLKKGCQNGCKVQSDYSFQSCFQTETNLKQEPFEAHILARRTAASSILLPRTETSRSCKALREFTIASDLFELIV